ncbi:hypothetical protein Tco_0760802 [Tanacetum coccineum]
MLVWGVWVGKILVEVLWGSNLGKIRGCDPDGDSPVWGCDSMHNGLEASIDHERAGRSLADIVAYDPSAEANYVSVVHALRGLDFPLLSQLESRKDTSIADIMSLLHLEGPATETPEASQLQPSYEQLMLPIHRTGAN